MLVATDYIGLTRLVRFNIHTVQVVLGQPSVMLLVKFTTMTLDLWTMLVPGLLFPRQELLSVLLLNILSGLEMPLMQQAHSLCLCILIQMDSMED
jgi:hypothetical protein